jgi:hypothetical protein
MMGAATAAALVASSALAQGSGDLYDPGQYYIEGVRAFCGDVETLVRTRAPELIAIQNQFTILINGPAFDALPPGVRLFVYFHTCGMLFFDNNTALADNFAVERGLEGRWLAATDIETVCTTDLLVQAVWTAAPDEARCQVIYDTMRRLLGMP